jgi:hypothetical protein
MDAPREVAANRIESYLNVMVMFDHRELAAKRINAKRINVHAIVPMTIHHIREHEPNNQTN